MEAIEVKVAGYRAVNPVRGLDPALGSPSAATVPFETEMGVDFELVYASEYRDLVALASSLTGNRAAAEDLAQEAFLRLHQRWSRVATYHRPGAWLRRVLLNLATSRRRRLAAEARALIRVGRVRLSHTVLSDEAAEFWAAVRALPRRQAQVLALYYGEDRSVSDVADILALADGTVRAHLHQGRQTLRTRLELDHDEEGRDD